MSRTRRYDLYYLVRTHYSLLITHLFILSLLFISTPSHSQVSYSIATDLSVMRNFSPKQKFNAIGQTVQGLIHFDKRESVYASLVYYSPGKFSNSFIAAARSPFTVPGSIAYRVQGTWSLRQISLGWKHYFRGSFDQEEGWNLYGLAGFGLMWSNTENILKTAVDTSVYQLAPSPEIGSGVFRRLTFDLGLGTEFPLGGEIFAYVDIRTWIPTTSHPNPLLHDNKNVPRPLIVCTGLRFNFANY